MRSRAAFKCLYRGLCNLPLHDICPVGSGTPAMFVRIKKFGPTDRTRQLSISSMVGPQPAPLQPSSGILRLSLSATYVFILFAKSSNVEDGGCSATHGWEGRKIKVVVAKVNARYSSN